MTGVIIMWLRLVTTAALLFLSSSAQECLQDGAVCDTHERCSVWAWEEGHCQKHHDYMTKHCPASCHKLLQQNTQEDDVEDEDDCVDHFEHCHLWALAGACKRKNSDVQQSCPKSCGTCGEGATAAAADERDRVLEVTEDLNEDLTEDLNEDLQQQEEEECINEHELCDFWAKEQECDKNSPYMHKHCAKACGTCKIPITKREFTDADHLIEATARFGPEQKAEGDERLRTLQVIEDSVFYMDRQIDNLPDDIRANCQNRNDLCAFWAAIGECKANEAFMLTNCAPSCKSCHLIDVEARCPILESAVPALRPGDLNKMFERIVATAPGNATLPQEDRRELAEKQIPDYTVQVLSRPSDEPATKIDSVEEMKRPPWVVVFDNFLTPEECQLLINWGHKNGYERSKDVGDPMFDGSFDSKESRGRTSENSWCSEKSGCRQDETVQRIMDRMSFVMGIPSENSEDLQMLRYENSQFYNAHHDYIPYQRERPCGPRILTFFLYLSDVEAGGGTRFTDLDITVSPKVGRALLWPSVRDSSPSEVDHRTRHEALPVESGVKFGSNAWYHLYDYIGAQAKGCT